MTKKEQIEEMAFIALQNTYTCAKQIAINFYNAGYRKIDEFAECRNCSAWSGTDCTRHPYTQGCLKDETNVKGQAVKEIALLKSQLKKELDEHEAFVNNMKNILEIEKKNAVKEFAEKLKAIISEKGTLVRDYTGDELVLRCEIDVDDVIELIDGLLK